MTPGPGYRKCTAYLWPGPGGTPLALRLTAGLDAARRQVAENETAGATAFEPSLERACDWWRTACCGTPRSRVACWKVPLLPARLRANKLTHRWLEAVAQGEGEAVRLRTARCAYYETSMLT